MDFTELQKQCYWTAEDHGWHEDFGPHTMVEKLMLIVSEASEALEHWRDGRGATEIFYRDNGKPDGVPIELADIVIRTMDLAGIYDIDLESAVIEKQAFNETRAFRHGGKRI